MGIFDFDNKEITNELLEHEGWDPKVIVKSRGKCWVKNITTLRPSSISQNLWHETWDRFLFEPDKMRVTYLNVSDGDHWIRVNVDNYEDVLVFIEYVLNKFNHKRVNN